MKPCQSQKLLHVLAEIDYVHSIYLI